MQNSKGLALLVSLFLIFSAVPVMATTIDSLNGQPWDIYDVLDGYDHGSVDDGGQDAFDNWGYLRVRVLDAGGATIVSDALLCGFGLTWDGGRRWETTTPVMPETSSCGGDARSVMAASSDIRVARSLYSPATANYLRYVDSFTNIGAERRTVYVAWGGNLGSDNGTTAAASSSGDYNFDTSDTWALTIEEYGSFNPEGPATDPPVGYVLGSLGNSAYLGTAYTYGAPYVETWPGNGDDGISFLYRIDLEPGQTVRLAYFLYRGLEENATGPLGQTPGSGEEIALAKTVLQDLSDNPDFGDLSAGVRSSIINWYLPPAFSLITPNGGEEIPTGSTHNITWDAFGSVGTGSVPAGLPPVMYKVFHSGDKGASWTKLADGLTSTSFDWYLPAQWGNTRQNLIRVVAYSPYIVPNAVTGTTKLGADVSDATFTIEVVKLTSPEGGSVSGGSTATITWDTFLTMRPAAQTAVQINCGTGWSTIATLSGNPGSYSWKVPSTLKGATCKAKVILKDRTHGVLGTDASNAKFAVK
ncbi:MAG: hypothetical protein FIA94_10805 [Nitrospirae bacterium]|nr:hypothetical protein [Nitrospirota bacterium]